MAVLSPISQLYLVQTRESKSCEVRTKNALDSPIGLAEIDPCVHRSEEFSLKLPERKIYWGREGEGREEGRRG